MNNIVVIVPEEYKAEEKDCPICKLALSSTADVINYKQNGCCKSCDDLYRYPNKEKWEEGWRPDN